MLLSQIILSLLYPNRLNWPRSKYVLSLVSQLQEFHTILFSRKYRHFTQLLYQTYFLQYFQIFLQLLQWVVIAELNHQVAVLSVNQVDQLTHQVNDVTNDQLMTSDYPLKLILGHIIQGGMEKWDELRNLFITGSKRWRILFFKER